ncbi:MAG: hypothetical protein OXD34_10845, partial [bacterium]|nr:hypothetical protein [bacterium]
MGSTIRRFFQQGILLTLVILVATGVTGLLSVADPDVAADPGYLASMLSCVIVGGPALMPAAYRERRRAVGGEESGFFGGRVPGAGRVEQPGDSRHRVVDMGREPHRRPLRHRPGLRGAG